MPLNVENVYHRVRKYVCIYDASVHMRDMDIFFIEYSGNVESGYRRVRTGTRKRSHSRHRHVVHQYSSVHTAGLHSSVHTAGLHSSVLTAGLHRSVHTAGLHSSVLTAGLYSSA